MERAANRQRFESVWDAIEATPAEARKMKLRSALMRQVTRYIREKGWTQAETAKTLRVTQPRVSDLMRGKIDLFSLDSLAEMAGAIGLHVELKVIEPV